MRIKDRIRDLVEDRGVAIRCDIHRQMKDEGVKRATTTHYLWELVDEAVLERDGYRYWVADGDVDSEDDSWDIAV